MSNSGGLRVPSHVVDLSQSAVNTLRHHMTLALEAEGLASVDLRITPYVEGGTGELRVLTSMDVPAWSALIALAQEALRNRLERSAER